MSSRQAALQLRRLARGRLPSELTQPSASRYASSPDTRLPGAAQARGYQLGCAVLRAC